MKRKRREKTTAKINQQKLDDKKAKKEGTYYSSGMALTVTPLATSLNTPACQPNTTTGRNGMTAKEEYMGTLVFASCGEFGHSRNTAKACKMCVKICKKCGGEGHEQFLS